MIGGAGAHLPDRPHLGREVHERSTRGLLHIPRGLLRLAACEDAADQRGLQQGVGEQLGAVGAVETLLVATHVEIESKAYKLKGVRHVLDPSA